MKLFKTSSISFLLSMLLGASIFIGIPFTWALLSDSLDHVSIDNSIIWVGVAMYAIYGVIQFLLSVTNLIQAMFPEKREKLFDTSDGLHPFYVAEIILYCMIFFLISVAIQMIGAVVWIFAFSIPYIICCTASVWFFRYFIKKSYKAEQEHEDESAV